MSKVEKKTENKMNKGDLERELAKCIGELDQQNTQLLEISQAYNAVLGANAALRTLVDQYERTINLLTARLIENQTQSS